MQFGQYLIPKTLYKDSRFRINPNSQSENALENLVCSSSHFHTLPTHLGNVIEQCHALTSLLVFDPLSCPNLSPKPKVKVTSLPQFKKKSMCSLTL